MGASRILLRKTKADQQRRAKVENRRIKPGTPNRRVIFEADRGGHEVSLHATKGWRRRRIPA